MNLNELFEGLDERIWRRYTDPDCWAKNLIIHKGRFPAWKRKHIAIFSLKKMNESPSRFVLSSGDSVRHALYPLQKGSGAYHIVDLGNLMLEGDFQAICQRIKLVCQELLNHQVIPVIIGRKHEYQFGQFQAYENQGKLISVCNIDARIDVNDTPKKRVGDEHLSLLLSHKPNYLFNFSHLAYQRYLNSSAALETLEQLYFSALSVGKMRENMSGVEPLIREADMLSIDLGAVRQEDAPANPQASSLGLRAEEICQLTWYAGLSEQLSSLGLYEYHPQLDQGGKTARLMANLIWYFVEGFYHRAKWKDFKSNAFMKYVVSNLDNSGNLTFYKHRVSQKWWMEVPYPEGSSNSMACRYVPCSYKDYQTANQGELPDRWINTYAKLV